MRRSKRQIPIMALLAALMVLSVVGPATAEEAGSGAPAISEQIDEVLRHNPGSRQVDADTVELEEGVKLTVLASAAAENTCAARALCLYDPTNYGGRYYLEIGGNCGRILDLEQYWYPGVGDWNDKPSSLINWNSNRTYVTLYDWTDSGGNRPIAYYQGGTWDRDLGPGVSNVVSRVKPC